MRGFNSRSSLFADGIRDPGSYARDTFFIEQVEIAKGPAAVMGGRGATGGLVNQVTKTPHGDSSSDFDVSAGTDDYVRATVDLNQPFGESLAGRLNLMYDDGQVPGRDVVETSRWGVAPSLAWDVGTETRLTLSYLHIEQDNVPGLRSAVEHAGRQRHRARSRLQQLLRAHRLRLRGHRHGLGHGAPDPRLHRRRPGRGDGALARHAARLCDHGAASTQSTASTAATGQRAARAADQRARRPRLGPHRPPPDHRAWRSRARTRTTATRRSRPTSRRSSTSANPNPSEQPLGPMPENVGNPGPSDARVDTRRAVRLRQHRALRALGGQRRRALGELRRRLPAPRPGDRRSSPA